MKYFTVFFIGILFFAIPHKLSAQDSLKQVSVFPTGISIDYGIGNYAVTDEYISEEKYSGSIPYYRIQWVKSHQDYIYHLSLDYQYSSDIKNYNVSTDIYQFTLHQGFSYAGPKFSLFNRDTYLYLGPSTEIFYYFNQQNIAVSGFDYAQSIACMISLGVDSDLIYKLNKNFNIESSLNLGLLSLGFRMVDSEETDESPVKLLTLFAGTNAVFKLGIRYYMTHNFSVKTGYLFHLTRISSWDPLLSASDSFVFTVTYGF
jgi:hypothetical protein